MDEQQPEDDKRSTTERLCDMLNEMGIRTTIVGRKEPTESAQENEARRLAEAELMRIARKSKSADR